MGLIKKALLMAFLAWLLVRIIMINRILRTVGMGIPVFNHNPGPCKLFHVNGSEDSDVLPNGLAVISSGLHYHLNPSGKDPAMHYFKGILYSLDLNNPNAKPTPLTYENFDDSEFSPHGIDFYIDPKTQKICLFVVNHAAEIESIEIFQFDQTNMVLKHRKTVVDDEKIFSPNDVVAVGPDSFYTANDKYFKNALLDLVEAFYPLKYTNVVFYNGSHTKSVAEHFQTANGINMDASGKYIFVSSVTGGEVVVFERTDKNDLIERQRIKTGVPADNINVDENGDLWLGVANFAIIDYSTNFTKPCPGAVVQVKLSEVDGSKVPFRVDDIREVFANSGTEEFKCVSSASFHHGKLLIGNPFSNLMYCDVIAY